MIGKFIVFEGIDGSGKSTQAKLLSNYLNSKCIETYLTSEPTNGPIGSIIRAFIKDSTLGHQVDKKQQFNKLMTYLFRADRIIHSAEIKRKINDGVWVVCDRYDFSTIAYNSNLENISDDSNELKEYFLIPDITFMIDVSVDEAINRINSRNINKEVFENKEFLGTVSNNYKFLDDIYKFHHINGMNNIDNIQKEIQNFINTKFGI